MDNFCNFETLLNFSRYICQFRLPSQNTANRGIKPQTFISPSSGDRKSKIRVPAARFLMQAPLLASCILPGERERQSEPASRLGSLTRTLSPWDQSSNLTASVHLYCPPESLSPEGHLAV